ncbi:DUF2141 domain-containing protein [Acetobacteraceae bacterium KSS8]|uniref:DUF2141 domain-containing protein n=1 Tax=Endosaccharibacter trunci TaxID=2812733 RepID=A0ABT1W6W4_9PROT|nr:DUF2141 domain-containing protein [Acetobacteraceae bacterium KSS8]
MAERTMPSRRGRTIGFLWPLRQRAALAAVLLGVFAAAPALAADPETARPCTGPDDPGRPRILAEVTGAHSTAGNITYTLYGDDPARFLKHKGSIALERVALTSRSALGCFVVSRPGIYAVAVYHDENNNHRFDRSMIGLPEEGYGFSRNAPIFMAPPSFDSVRFQAGPGDTSVSIALRY